MRFARLLVAAVVAALVAVGATACATSEAASGGGSGGTLVVGMTAADLPPLDTVLSGAQGYEGYRFVGNQLYDGLTRFDLKQSTEVPRVIGGLATSWRADATATVWTFTLRSGVTFTDGTAFDADAVIFNLDRYANPKSTYYDAELGAVASLTLSSFASYRKLGPMTVQITTKYPDAHLPGDLTTLYLASPTAVRKYGNKGFGAHPSGTGPFEFVSEQRGQQLVLAPNEHYWGGAPKLGRLILKPIPDATARIAALRSGQVNWIEYPTPDDIAGLQKGGYRVVTNGYDHVWPWIFDIEEKPWNDVRVRRAANYAINRPVMVKHLLHDTADPADQLAPRANSAYDPAADVYRYDPARAKRLLAQAGYPHGVHASVSYPTSGSGNMVPGPMNEELQQDLAAVGIHVSLKPIEWATMLTEYEAGKVPAGATATNISLSFQQEGFWALGFSSQSPVNVSHYHNAKVDRLLGEAQAVVDPVERAKVYAQVSALVTRDAPWLFVVNDRNPRALAPNVDGFIEPKSWFVDLTTVSVS